MKKGKPPAPAQAIPAPAHLSEHSRLLWAELVPRRAKSPERLELLTVALEARDRAEQARLAIEKEELTVTTKTTGAIHLHPLLRVEKEARQQFLAAWAALHLGWYQPLDSGPVVNAVDYFASRRFGLSAEAAGGLSLEIKSLGLDAGGVSGALTAFQRHLGEAASGEAASGEAASGEAEAARSFHGLGINAQELVKLPLEQQLGLIGDALKKLPGGAQQTSAAYSVLTRRGAELLPIVRQGSAALAAASAQAQRWGLTFSAADAEMVRSAGVAQRSAINALDSVRQSIASRIAVAFAPITQGFAEATVSFVDLIQPVLQLFRDGIGAAGVLIKDVVAGVKAGFADFAGPLEEAKAQLTVA